ncbi:PQQ-binding-like beta-propeller repeat protein [Streptomyces kunmingensis]|uniref:PQQ-binding-like beta-propeller repeat protein n=1 Tax=Streptomyces kunmingensis TaxID=68225 RepID=A0ABU6C7F4_9ACTN|nr:PQQ-binding-like beta-propeller repeat protein [Streptomyces kunmingensis]MEB3960653.1 PQQ-binding-like beta-propeller repeat protein [Streptomyces kunmingensis]
MPGRTATAAELTDATLGYRADGRADSLVVGATAAPPYKKLWSRDFGTVVSAPVAIGDKVYAVVNADDGTEGGPRMMLVGVHAATGKDLWPAVRLEQNEPQAGVAYGGGLLYTQTSRGTIAAWDPATGKQKWSVTLDSASMQYPPVWYDGLLYLQDGRGTALALRADSGAQVWATAPLAEYSSAPTVVDASGVWIGFDGIGWHHLDRRTGAELHRFEVPDRSGAYGNPVVLGAGAAWMRSSDSDDETVTAYDQKTGQALRKLPADATPAFGPGRVYVAHHGKVQALSTSTYKAAWTYTSSVDAATVRLVANGYVYVEDADGRLVVLDQKTGNTAWSYRRYPAPHPQSIINAEDDWRGFIVPGIATSKARLFVPGAEGTLIGFGKA